MVITVQFKDRNKVFKGPAYDYRLHSEETTPRRGSIIRLMDENYEWRHYGTRVKVVDIRWDEKEEGLDVVRYVEANLED